MPHALKKWDSNYVSNFAHQLYGQPSNQWARKLPPMIFLKYFNKQQVRYWAQIFNNYVVRPSGPSFLPTCSFKSYSSMPRILITTSSMLPIRTIWFCELCSFLVFVVKVKKTEANYWWKHSTIYLSSNTTPSFGIMDGILSLYHSSSRVSEIAWGHTYFSIE